MRFLLLLLLPLCPSPAFGQEPTAVPKPSGRVPVIGGEITLDGFLDEEAWAGALLLDEFIEVDPDQGQAADPQTQILVMRSNTHLYLAFRCMEPEPETMVLQNLRRDAFLNDDDRIEFVLDTFHDHKTSYFFQISAAGSRGDALLGDNGRRFNKPWNGFWQGRTRIAEDRWVAEVAIPFSSLAFGSGDVWGANFERTRGKDRSDVRWAGARREVFIGNVSEAGELSGFAGIEQGLGLEFKPYFKMKARDNQVEDLDILTELGGEVNWRITPQLTGSLTWNTDFAETEVDERRANLSRFPLFFPEKRDFFLQDTTLFQFGERGRRGNGSNLLPFFSRRIGLLEGAEVPLDYGLRLAGRAGPWDIGFLGVHTGAEASVGAPESELFVFRPSYNVSKSLAIGALFTDGNPASDLSNTVAGADLRWSTTKLLPGSLSLNSYLVHSDDEATSARGLGYGTEMNLSTSSWDYNFSVLGTQGDFQPALGFVRRPGEMRTNLSVFWNPRPQSGPIRNYSFGMAPLVWTDLGGEVISSQVRLGWLELETNAGDGLRFNSILASDRPDVDFTVADDVVIAAGDYSWTEHQLRLSTSSARALEAEVQVTTGNWFDGDILRFRSGLTWRPDAHLRMELEYNEDRGSVSGGDFTVRIERLSFDYSLNSEVSLETLIQADNQSDTLGLQARYRWILEDGRELFVVLDSGWRELATGAIVQTEQDLTAKIVYAIRF